MSWEEGTLRWVSVGICGCVPKTENIKTRLETGFTNVGCNSEFALKKKKKLDREKDYFLKVMENDKKH